MKRFLTQASVLIILD